MSTDLETFRLETRAWLEENCPASQRIAPKKYTDLYWGGRNAKFADDDQRVWFERMLEKRWIVPEWDTKYGGGGLSQKENNIFIEEMTRLNCRKPIMSFGISMLGPALLNFGTEEQKVKYLNEICRGEIWWCQGYSEPNAGSDLAGLQTKAADQGDHFLVNGTKVWTSFADHADWIFCLVRTDPDAPKHLGISFILIDMATEGVSTRPIKLISGSSPFCETFFEDVKVPKENQVGPLNGGWSIAKYLLTHERQMIGGIGDTGTKKSLAKSAIESVGLDENGILDDLVLRPKVSKQDMDDELFGMTIARAMDEAKAGHNSGAISSMFKYYYTEQNIRRYELLMALNGSAALEWEGEESGDGHLAKAFCRTKGNAIEGGTHEVQLNIIAKQILRLPTR